MTIETLLLIAVFVVMAIFLYFKEHKDKDANNTDNEYEDTDSTNNTQPPQPLRNIPKLGLKVMFVADCHGKLMQRDIDTAIRNNGMPDIVFMLGDNSANDIEALQDNEHIKNLAFYGIVGNHDSKNLLKEYNIPDIHLKTVQISGYTVGGFGGSMKYKDDDYYMLWTNPQSSQALSLMPKCDILLTHSSPAFEITEPITSHSGLIGIGEYIDRHSPKYVFHGHLHEPYAKDHNNTRIQCLYGVSIMEI